MDSVFWITCFALACQFAVVTYRNIGPVQPEVETPKAYAKAAGKAVEEAAKAAAALRVGDAALACLNYPGGWMWPLAVAALVTYLLRRKSTLNKISTTTGRRFLLDMGALMAQLQASTAHFVHCVKPNGMEQRELLSYEMVAEQLQPWP